MSDDKLQKRIDHAEQQRKIWEASYKHTGSYTALCNMEDSELLLTKLNTEKLKREGLPA